MKLSTKHFVILVITVYWGLIVLSMASGLWDTYGFANENKPTVITPEEVTGMMTVQELLNAFALDKETFYANFKIPPSEPTSQSLRSLVHKYGFEVEDIRKYLEENLPPKNTSSGLNEPCENCADKDLCIE